MADLTTIAALKTEIDNVVKSNAGTHDETKSTGAGIRALLKDLIDTVVGVIARTTKINLTADAAQTLPDSSGVYLISGGFVDTVVQPLPPTVAEGTQYTFKRIDNGAVVWQLTGLSAFDPANPGGLGVTTLNLTGGDAVTVRKFTGNNWYIINYLNA